MNLESTPSPPIHPTQASLISLACAAGSFILPPVVIAAAVVAHADFLIVGIMLALALIVSNVLLSLFSAHFAWRAQLSGQYERGLRWALSAMVVAHAALAFWAIRLASALGDGRLVQSALICVLIFVAASALAMQSHAVKYLAVGSLMFVIGLGLLTCKLQQQREITRRNASMMKLRLIGEEMAVEESRGNLQPLASEGPTFSSEENAYSWVRDLLPHLHESATDESGEGSLTQGSEAEDFNNSRAVGTP